MLSRASASGASDAGFSHRRVCAELLGGGLQGCLFLSGDAISGQSIRLLVLGVLPWTLKVAPLGFGGIFGAFYDWHLHVMASLRRHQLSFGLRASLSLHHLNPNPKALGPKHFPNPEP